MNYLRMNVIIALAAALLFTCGAGWAFGSIAAFYGVLYKCQS